MGIVPGGINELVVPVTGVGVAAGAGLVGGKDAGVEAVGAFRVQAVKMLVQIAISKQKYLTLGVNLGVSICFL